MEIIFNKFYKLFINELNTYKNKIDKYDIEKRDLQFAIIPSDKYEGNLSKYANIFLKIFKNTIKKVENDLNFKNIRIQDDWIYNDTAYCISFYKK